jgi:hypothetical protein
LRISLAVAFVLALAAPALAAPSPSPVPALAPAKPLTVPQLQAENAALLAQLNKFGAGYQQFGLSVYAPWCAKDGGVAKVALAKPFTAWPAKILCKDNAPPITVEAPKL